MAATPKSKESQNRVGKAVIDMNLSCSDQLPNFFDSTRIRFARISEKMAVKILP